MSLVEQAARRLEELRRAGSEMPGQLPFAAEGAETTESTIERAARRLAAVEVEQEPPGTTTVAPESAAETELGAGTQRRAPVAPAPAPVADTPEDAAAAEILGWGQHTRHEPILAAHAALQPDEPVGYEGVQAPVLELDLARLSTLGFLTPDKSDSALANQLRFIKRPLINAVQGKSSQPVKNANKVMITSALPGEGKSFVALNLALSMAMERDCRVLLIDGDTTRPALSAILGTSLSPGLLDLLTNPGLDVGKVLLKSNVERLTVLPSGTPRANATELLASETMESLVRHLASRYADRILIFDAPPLLAAPEPPVLASYMGQIVVVVEAQRTTRKTVQQALAAVESCPAVMTVLNKVEGSSLPSYGSRSVI
jgi:protein-tyrosine kinase